MRSDKAFKNMLSNIILQLVTAAVGIILPRLFIGVYGSEVNGLISSISQFITYMGLVEAGIGSAAIVSLYKPLADKNTDKINGVLSGAKLFYAKSGLFFVGLVLALVIFYPLLTTTTSSFNGPPDDTHPLGQRHGRLFSSGEIPRPVNGRPAQLHNNLRANPGHYS